MLKQIVTALIRTVFGTVVEEEVLDNLVNVLIPLLDLALACRKMGIYDCDLSLAHLYRASYRAFVTANTQDASANLSQLMLGHKACDISLNEDNLEQAHLHM